MAAQLLHALSMGSPWVLSTLPPPRAGASLLSSGPRRDRDGSHVDKLVSFKTMAALSELDLSKNPSKSAT